MSKLYCFGPFRLNPIGRSLLKDGVPAKLSETEMTLLLVLAELQRPGQIVPKAVLRERIWGADTHVQDNSLNQAVSRLRKSLGPRPSPADGEPSYIKTGHNKGYCLTEIVWTEPLTSPAKSTSIEKSVALETQRSAPRSRSQPWLLAIGSSSLLLAVASMLVRSDFVPRTVTPVPVTADEFSKGGPLWTDGERVYFTELVDRTSKLASAPTGGGDVVRNEIPGMAEAKLLDARSPGPEFLLRCTSTQGDRGIWRWMPGRPPECVVHAERVDGAAWISGNRLVYMDGAAGQIKFVDLQGHVERVVSVSGAVSSPSSSPSRGILRFTVSDRATTISSIWQIRDHGSGPQPIVGLPKGAQFGTWGADSKLFTFVAPSAHGVGLWAAVEGQDAGGSRLASKLLIDTPFNYDHVVPSPDGGKVFALATQENGELVEYDRSRNRFIPYRGGISALELDFSNVGGWIAYVRYPDRTLWKVKADGTSTCLLGTAMQVAEPRWSPDGSQIAFVGQRPQGPRRIYLIKASGGVPREAHPGGAPQGVPTWSPDGDAIAFGDVLGGSTDPMRVHILSLKRQTVLDLPGSEGLWSPRWSPNGHLISALTIDSRRLKLYDIRTREWRSLDAKFENIDHVHWTPDSSYIHFRGATDEHIPGRPFDRALYRIEAATGQLEKITDLDWFPFATFEWFGITPDGVPLGLSGKRVQQIYALPVQ
jgi:Tol biopolymer transport system component/DNA-binding winged helix-turn-helix (wHTH) protein